MKTTRPASRHGITPIPASVEYAAPFSTDDLHELRETFSGGPYTFGAIIRDYVRVARVIVAETTGGDESEGSLRWLAKDVRKRYLFTLRMIRNKNADMAARAAWMLGVRLEQLRVKLANEKDAIRGEQNLQATKDASKTKHEQSEEDGAALCRRFDNIRNTHDEWTNAAIYQQIARDVQRGQVKLSKGAKPTVAAIERKIQRYRAPLR